MTATHTDAHARRLAKRWRAGAIVTGTALALAAAVPAFAEVDEEVAYILNTFSFLVTGFLVMWMAAGFAMLETGFVRAKHAGVICMKNLGLYSIAGIMYYLVGYQFMYNIDAGAFLGGPGVWGPAETYTGLSDLADSSPADYAAYFTGANLPAGEDPPGYAAASDWFFQMVFVATAASIVSGAVAERSKIGSFFIFTAVLTAVIYPIQGSWEWGGGWLNAGWYEEAFGGQFSDFAGSTIVHSCGGWAALAGVILIGARTGRFVDGKAQAMHGSSLPLATLGTFILWLGWFGFNGGSQLALGSGADATAIAQIFANTNMAAAGGVVVAYLLSLILGKGKANLGFALNGALAGLVSITAEPLMPNILEAIIIGGVGAVIATFGTILLEKLRIDDVVGAIPVHLMAGIWGTLVVAYSNPDATYLGQLIGIVSIGGFVFVVSFVLWLLLKMTIGIRLKPEAEVIGGDLTELGHEAYPEFGAGKASAPAA